MQQAISLSFFNSTLKFSESFNYNLEENHPDSLKFAASWKGISASYVMSYTTGADFDENTGWIAKKNKEFLPYSASLTIAPTFKTYKTWFNRITFTPSINSLDQQIVILLLHQKFLLQLVKYLLFLFLQHQETLLFIDIFKLC